MGRLVGVAVQHHFLNDGAERSHVQDPGTSGELLHGLLDLLVEDDPETQRMLPGRTTSA